jgi:hypothetical protein
VEQSAETRNDFPSILAKLTRHTILSVRFLSLAMPEPLQEPSIVAGAASVLPSIARSRRADRRYGVRRMIDHLEEAASK